MQIDYRTALWRGRNGRLWRLADLLEETAQAVRYANKPYDLVFPTTRFTELANQIRQMQWEWVAELTGMDKRDRGKFPRL